MVSLLICCYNLCSPPQEENDVGLHGINADAVDRADPLQDMRTSDPRQDWNTTAPMPEEIEPRLATFLDNLFLKNSECCQLSWLIISNRLKFNFIKFQVVQVIYDAALT